MLRRHTVDFFAVDTLDVDDPLATVDLDNLSLTALVGSSGNDHLIVLANWKGLYAVLGTQLLGQGRGHHEATYMRGRAKVGLAALAAGRCDVYLAKEDRVRIDRSSMCN